jgi:hypothetical protein
MRRTTRALTSLAAGAAPAAGPPPATDSGLFTEDERQFDLAVSCWHCRLGDYLMKGR